MTRLASLRRGWCPGALRPMPTGDGLLVRIRLRGGRLPVPLARILAEAARRFGNGSIDLSARANLQLRGFTEATHAALLAYLADADILDDDPNAEAVRNIVASPLAGSPDFGALLDLPPILTALDTRLATDARLRTLPTKFGFLLDDGGWPSLADASADVRFEACLDDGRPVFRVSLSGTAQSATTIGACAPDDVADVATRIALAFLAAREEAQDEGKCALRMRDLVGKGFGPSVANAIGLIAGAPTRSRAYVTGPASPIGHFTGTSGQSVLGLGVVFGRLTAETLERVAEAAEDLDCDTLRVTPWRALLFPIGKTGTLDEWLSRFKAEGFILDPADPRRAIAACPGAPACVNATTSTQDDALRLAPLARQLSAQGIGLHVSGCAKGCAHSGRAPVTLVAASGLYGLVLGGTAQDEISAAPITIAAAEAALQRLIANHSANHSP
jgi:precorrin-3B synthase